SISIVVICNALPEKKGNMDRRLVSVSLADRDWRLIHMLDRRINSLVEALFLVAWLTPRSGKNSGNIASIRTSLQSINSLTNSGEAENRAPLMLRRCTAGLLQGFSAY